MTHSWAASCTYGSREKGIARVSTRFYWPQLCRHRRASGCLSWDACRNSPEFEVVVADLADMPLALRERQFDHVLANPPYFDRDASVAAKNRGRETALGEQTPLETWVKMAARRLAPKGQAHFIHRAERLPDLIRALPKDMGSIEVLPIAPRVGRLAELVILRARKNGRAAFRLNPPLVMHQGPVHVSDGDSFVSKVRAVLRDGAALEF